jgi:hypothetical protein
LNAVNILTINALHSHHCLQVDVKLESDHSESEEEREEEEEDIAVPDSEPLEDSVSPVQKNTSKKTETRKRRAKIWRYFEDANTAGESVLLIFLFSVTLCLPVII